jgi:tetratricopeptide (TPR) repeat protein
MTSADELVNQAIKLIKKNDKRAASLLLKQAIKIDPKNERAWASLADTTDKQPERLKYLQRSVKIKEEKEELQAKIHEAEVKTKDPSLWKRLWSKENRLRTLASTLIFTLIPFVWWIIKDVVPELRSIKQMTGEWNVAVVSFTDLDTDLHRSDIVLISSIFSNRFNQELESLVNDASLVVQVWGPQQIDRSISGISVEERAVKAERLAAGLNADLLIYGTIQQTDIGYVLQPEFYIRAENYYEADELVGQHRFGGPISITATRDTLPTQIPLNIELSRRSGILALVARGLSLYLVQSYEKAYELFTQANQDDLWQNPEGREFIYLFQGNAAIRSQNFKQAQQAYNQTIQIEPQYGRGYIGLGNVTYSLALESASNFTFVPDQNGLDQSKAYFEQALQTKIQPPSAEIPSRAAFGIGQIYLVKWFSGQDTRDQAIEEFNTVLNNYEDGENPRLQELASETHARLGVIYRQDKQVDTTIAELQQALALSTMPSRRGLYWASLSDLFDQQGDQEKAQNAGRQSIEQYQLAIALPLSDELKAFYWGKIGERYASLKDTALAIHAYEQALSLLTTESVDYLMYQQRIRDLQP